MGGPAIFQTVQGWLFSLYDSELRVAHLKELHAPPQVLEGSRTRLRQKWEQAKQAGITEEMFSANTWPLYIDDVGRAIELSYRDSCACHKPDKDGLPHLAPCRHYDSPECCSPFCPKFKQKK